jgi:hypothetical protein
MTVGLQNPNLVSVLSVVESLNEISVADYQRSYSWTSNEIDELFRDIDSTIENNDDHFFGTLILQHNPTYAKSAEIVDGQQRLTTFFIIAATLRDAIKTLGVSEIPADNPEKEAPAYPLSEVHSILYYTNRFSDIRFRSNSLIRDILIEHVVSEPPANAKRKPLPVRGSEVTQLTVPFRKAVNHVRKFVSEKLDGMESDLDRLRYIHQVLTTLSRRFKVLNVNTANTSESLEIFLTLNNRGLPLGPSDLVRGLIMSQLGAGLNPTAQSKLFSAIFEEWTNITDNVEEPETFLRHYLLSTGESPVQKKRVFDEVKKLITSENLESEATRALAQTFWDDLIQSSDVYAQIIEPKDSGLPPKVKLQIDLLEGLGKSHRIPLMQLLRDDLSNSGKEIVRLIFVLTFKWYIAGKNAQILESFYQDVATKIRKKVSLDSIINDLRSEISKIHVDFDDMVATDADSGFIGRAVLFAIHRSMADGVNLTKLGREVTLEHIAPKSTAKNDWEESLLAGDTSGRSYAALKSNIGNLTLLDHGLNSKIKTLPFKVAKTGFHGSSKTPIDKVSAYEASSFFMTTELKSLDQWTFIEIEERAKWVAEMFDIVFSAMPPSKKAISFTSWVKQQNL